MDPQTGSGVALVVAAVGAVAALFRAVWTGKHRERENERQRAYQLEEIYIARTQDDIKRLVERVDDNEKRILELEGSLREEQLKSLRLERELNLVTMERDRLLSSEALLKADRLEQEQEHARLIRRIDELETALRVLEERLPMHLRGGPQ